MSSSDPVVRNPSIKRLPEVEFITLFALMMSLTALTTDAMLPAFSFIAQDLAIDNYQHTQWIISAMILGMVFGEITFGPLSDAIGRKKSIGIGIGIYLVGTLVALCSMSLEMLLLGRLIQGFGVSAPKIASRALIRDLYQGAAMARIMSFIMMVFLLVPLLAPAIGQWVMQLGNWRWIFAMLLMQSLVALAWLYWRQPETLPVARRIPLRWRNLLRDAREIMSHKEVVAFTLLLGCIFGSLMLYISTAQSIFQDIYGVGDDFPLYFAMMAIGSSIMNFFNGKIVLRVGMKACVYFALTLMVCLSFVLSLVVLSYDGVPPFVYFMAICMAMFSCFGMVFGNVNAMAMEPLGRTAGLGASMISSLSSFVAILVSASIGQFYQNTLTPFATGFFLLSVISSALMFVAIRFSSLKNVSAE